MDLSELLLTVIALLTLSVGKSCSDNSSELTANGLAR